MPELTFAAVSAEPATAEALALFCEKLGQATGMAFRGKVLESYAELRAGALSGALDLIWAPPLIAIDLEDAAAAESAVVVHRSTRAGYHGALFVRADSRFAKVEALSQARAAWVSKDSASGYFVPRWHLRSMGLRLEDCFASETILGSHEAVTRAVLEGSADVGATHVGLDAVTGKLAAASWLSMGYPASSVRVLLLLGPIPGDVIAIGHHVEATVRQRVVAALVTMSEETTRRSLFEASQFDPVPDGHLELLRRLSRFRETRA